MTPDPRMPTFNTMVDIRAIQPAEVEDARLLLSQNGWQKRVGNPLEFDSLLANSTIAIVAVSAGRVVGFLRALCDGSSNGYISMVVVAEDHRRLGIGARLVQTAMGSDERVTWVLRAAREGAKPFYEKLGFVVSTVAMERRGVRG